MNLENAIRGRRSVRIYNDTLVDNTDIRNIIEAGIWAPSACNLQQWKFIVINEQDTFAELYRLGAASFLKDVKQGILILYNNQTDNLEYNDYIQSAAAAIENMLLKAYSLGIGSCWINNLPNKKVLRKFFDIPEYYDPIALVTVGYPAQKVNERERKYTIDQVISYGKFNFKETSHKSKGKVAFKRIARKIYKVMPMKTVVNKVVGKMEKKFDN